MQLASFMEDLEASGLLKDEAQPSAATGAAGSSAGATPDGSLAEAEALPGSPPAQMAGPSPAVSTVEACGSDNTEEAAAGAADDAGGEEELAEQRVLGDLQGAPGWFEVMDMASRKVRPLGGSRP